jgi:hypothetical protein
MEVGEGLIVAVEEAVGVGLLVDEAIAVWVGTAVTVGVDV